MEDGRDRARRSTGRPPAAPPREHESVDDVLTRHGLLAPGTPGAGATDVGPAVTGGRAARRRAAEERERAAAERPARSRVGQTEPAPPVTSPPAARLRTPAEQHEERLQRLRRPGRDDIGSGLPDVSESAERTRRADRVAGNRARHIDETLTRLTAAHAGLDLSGRDDEPPAAGEPRTGAGMDLSGRDDEPPAAGEPRTGAGRDPSGRDDGPPISRRPRTSAGRWRPSGGRLVVGALAAIVLVTTTAGWAAKGWLESGVRAVAALDPGSAADADAQVGDRNVLVVATDTGRAPGAVTTNRSDTVTVAHVPATGGPVVALSVPIDLEINRPPCERFDPVTLGYTEETVPAEARTKLVSALEAGGPRCATRVVQQLTGLAITGYVGMDLAGLGAAVDAVSGVAVCVPRPVIDGALGPVLPDAGHATLDGTRAADFVRAADVNGDPSAEYGRIERQQQVLAAVLDAALSTTGLLDPGRLTALRPALHALVSDGAGLDQILAMARSLQRLDAPGVAFAAVPTGPEVNGRGNAVLRGTEATALFTALRHGTPLPEGAGDPGPAGSDPTPGDAAVQILNASDRAGLAAEVGKTLSALGFVAGEVGNADAPAPETMIRFSPDRAAAAGLLAATVPSGTPAPVPGTTGVLQLVLGRTFDGVVRAPSEPVTLRSGGATADCA